ncbi:hypothetical protein LOAG_15564, partial [Loa loa]
KKLFNEFLLETVDMAGGRLDIFVCNDMIANYDKSRIEERGEFSRMILMMLAA